MVVVNGINGCDLRELDHLPALLCFVVILSFAKTGEPLVFDPHLYCICSNRYSNKFLHVFQLNFQFFYSNRRTSLTSQCGTDTTSIWIEVLSEVILSRKNK